MRKTNPSVLLINYHSSLNCGDQALLEVNLQQVRQGFEPSSLTVAVNWPDEPYFRAAKNFRVVTSPWQLIGSGEYAPAWKQMARTLEGYLRARLFRLGNQRGLSPGWRELFEAYQKADVVASVSGTHFYTTGRYGWPFPLKGLMVDLAYTFGKPLYVLPQSIGPLRWGWERSMLRSLYSRARLVLLRDQFSMRLAQSIGLPPDRVRFSPDPAFAFPAGDADQAGDLLKRYAYDASRPAIGATLIPWQGRWLTQETMAQYFRSLGRFYKRLADELGAQIYLFNQVTGPTKFDDDRIAAKYLLDEIGGGASWFTYVDEVLSPAQLKACYGLMDLFVATRMHSGIFALAQSVPVIFIGYISKTRGLMEWLGLEDWVVDLDQVDENKLWEKAIAAWEQRAERKALLAELMPKAARDVGDVSDWMKKDYAAYQS